MPAKHPPRTHRERAFSSLALLSAGALFTSSTIIGLSALGKGAATAGEGAEIIDIITIIIIL